MQDVLTMLQTLKRPAILMRAARHGAEDYRRNLHLSRLLGYGQLPRHTQALMRLIELELMLNAQRKDQDSAYDLLRHVDILIAIVGEARVMRATQAEAA